VPLGPWLRFLTTWQTPSERIASEVEARKLATRLRALTIAHALVGPIFTIAVVEGLTHVVALAIAAAVAIDWVLPWIASRAVAVATAFATSDAAAPISAAYQARQLWLLAEVIFWAWASRHAG